MDMQCFESLSSLLEFLSVDEICYYSYGGIECIESLHPLFIHIGWYYTMVFKCLKECRAETNILCELSEFNYFLLACEKSCFVDLYYLNKKQFVFFNS